MGQSLWILLANAKKKNRIGVTYAPQENLTPNNRLKLMYEDRTNKNTKRRETENTSSRRL